MEKNGRGVRCRKLSLQRWQIAPKVEFKGSKMVLSEFSMAKLNNTDEFSILLEHS